MQGLKGPDIGGGRGPPCWADLVLEGRYTYVLLDWALQQQELQFAQDEQQPSLQEPRRNNADSGGYFMGSSCVSLAQLLLFLLCSDERRFVLRSPERQGGGEEGREVLLIVRNSEHFLKSHPDLTDARLVGSLGPAASDAVSFVVRRGVPLPALLAAPCSLAWQRFQCALTTIYGSVAFSSFRRLVVSGLRIDMRSVLASREMRPHLEQFLTRRHPRVVPACKLWVIVSDVLEGLDRRLLHGETISTAYTLSSAVGVGGAVISHLLSAAAGGAAHIQTALYPAYAASPHPPSPDSLTSNTNLTFKSHEVASSDSASTYDLWSLLGYSCANHRAHTHETSSAGPVHGKVNNIDSGGVKPYELLGAMVTALRSVQRVLSAKDRAVGGMPEPPDASPHPAVSARGQVPLGSAAWDLSEAAQLELQTAVAMTAMVRSASNAESVEITYARTCVEKLYRVFKTIEKEASVVLDSVYEGFLASDEYFDLVACQRCRESPRVCEYRRFEDFIAQVKSLQQIGWRDSPDRRAYRLYTRTVAAPSAAIGATASSATAQVPSSTRLLDRLYGPVIDDAAASGGGIDVFSAICAAGGPRTVALLGLLFLTGRHIVIVGGSIQLAELIKNTIEVLLDPIPVPHKIRICVPASRPSPLHAGGAEGADCPCHNSGASGDSATDDAVRSLVDALGLSTVEAPRRESAPRGVFTQDKGTDARPYCIATSHSVFESFAVNCGFIARDFFVFDLDSCQVRLEFGNNELLKFCSSAVCRAPLSAQLMSSRRAHCFRDSLGRLLKQVGCASAVPCTSRDAFVRNAFKTFFFDIILRFVPVQLEHYPESGVISCNVGGFIDQALNECKLCKSCASPSSSSLDTTQVYHRVFLESFADSAAFEWLLDSHGAAFDACVSTSARTMM